MVPIVRSFISVPAGVVRMSFGQFVLYSAAGSLIWNSVLIGLGVALGDVVNEYLQYFDYLIYAAVALGVGWLVWKRAKDVRRHHHARTDPGAGRGDADRTGE